MPAFLVPAILSGLSALSGAFGNRSQTQTSSQNSSGTTNPVYDSSALDFRNQLINKYLASIQNPLDLTGYEASGVENINKTRELQKQRQQEMLSARGIRGPALDFAAANTENDRFSDLIGFRQGIPLLKNQLEQDILGKASGFFNTIPFGTSQTSSTESKGTLPGNVAGGLTGNLSNMLAFLFGQGAFGNNDFRRSTVQSPNPIRY